MLNRELFWCRFTCIQFLFLVFCEHGTVLLINRRVFDKKGQLNSGSQ